MLKDGKLLIGRGDTDAAILPNMANRHGLIAGATGTGKTITLKVIILRYRRSRISRRRKRRPRRLRKSRNDESRDRKAP